MGSTRDYDSVVAALRPAETREAQLQAVVDAIWSTLAETGVSWVGFYLDHPGEPDDRRLVLGPHRDSLACSPIGLHGVCGMSLVQSRDVVIDDVSTLGDDYVACDPRDRSEVCVPLVDADGAVWAVLDLDSREVGAFDEGDAAGLRRVLHAAGLG